MLILRHTLAGLLALAAAAAGAAADDWHALNHRAAAQARAGDYGGLHDTLAQLAPALPGSPTIVYNLAASAAKLGHPDEAIAALARLADAGLAYDPAADADFASLAGRADFQALRERLSANKNAIGASTRVMAFASPDTIPEALAWDGDTQRLFVGDVRHCEIRVVTDPRRPGAVDRRFARLPASVFALGIDAKRQRLWATIATVAQADGCGEGSPKAERTALLALDLRTGRVLQRVEAGLPGVLGDMLVAGDGSVFVTESVHGAVLRLRPGATAFDRLDVAGDFDSPQQPVLSADGRTLIVPDYVRGIGLVALDAPCPCAARWPANGAGVFSAGIDGLVRDGESLVAVQNGSAPPRVIRFADDLQRQQVLEAGTPGFGEPTHGIVVDRELWFIADVGWDRFDEAGRRKPGAPASRATLRAIALDPDAVAIEGKLRRQTQQLLDAIAPGDVAVWERWLDPAVLYVDENDVVRGKAEMIKELQPLPKGLVGHLKIAEFRMTLAGDTAVVTHEDDESLDYFGQPRSRRLFQRDASGAITGFVDRREERDIQWKRAP